MAGLFNEQTQYEEKQKKFKTLLEKGKDLRELEENIQGPDTLEKTKLKGKQFQSRKILFYFDNEEALSLVKKYFKVLEYVELNVGDSTLLLRLLKSLEENKIRREDLSCWKKSESLD